ncbi:MAG: hypothetical protein H7X80_04070 [bacterium]|nr:hypothetical protein [Candidatus Kapabacteria bacterium]
MIDLITIPINGGYADITLFVFGILLIVGALFAYRHFNRKDDEEYSKRLK